MDFNLPPDVAAFLAEMDAFIERELVPLERRNDNVRFFDHRREDARTDWHRGGLPNEERGGGGLPRHGREDGGPRGALSLSAPERVRRARRYEPRHGHHSRAPGGEGP